MCTYEFLAGIGNALARKEVKSNKAVIREIITESLKIKIESGNRGKTSSTWRRMGRIVVRLFIRKSFSGRFRRLLPVYPDEVFWVHHFKLAISFRGSRHNP